ncbi:MAG: hypothetical protein WCO82_12240 [Sphingomonadales bacterium]
MQQWLRTGAGLALLSMATAALATRPVPSAEANAKSCLSLSQIQQSRVIDDQTIEFTTRNRQVWRNRLPSRCPGLGFERAFSYSTSIPQLCSFDIITVLQQSAGVRPGASCGLGVFVPVSPAP